MGNKSNKGKNPSYDELENSAQGLLRRLNNRYDAGRVEAEKNAMKNLDAMDEPDAEAPDVVAYEPTQDMPAVEEVSANEDKGEISGEELQTLFDKYLGSDEDREQTPASYDSVHQQILDAEEKSGMSPAPQTDVKKNIDEAEKYVDELAARTGENERVVTGEYVRPTVDSAEMVAAYEPPVVKEEVIGTMPDRIYTPSEEDEKDPLQDVNSITDTTMMRAFGLSPHENADKDEDPFAKFSLADTMDIQSTEEISLRELDEYANLPHDASAPTTGDFEYTAPEQNKKTFSIFKAKYNFSKVRMILSGLLAVFLLLIENFTAVQELLGSKLIVTTVDWILAFACVALVSDRIMYAIRSLGKFRFDADSVTLLALILSAVATMTAAFLARSYETIPLYNFTLALCVFMNSVHIFISLRRDVYSFKVVSSGKVKRVIAHMDSEEALLAPENTKFADYLGAESELCEMKKTDFVSDFFARRKEPAKAKSALRIFLPICFGVSVVFFLLAYLVMEETLAASFGAAYATFMMCTPFTVFLSYTYPMYLASRRAFAYNSAIVGDNTPDDYANTSVITVRDEDAFPAGKIKMKSIKIYADRNIENIIYYASSVFSKVGGPLATVFKQATLGSRNSEYVDIRELSNDGVSAMVDGKSIVIGKPSYMEAQCFETLPDTDDIDYEGKSNKRILYLACDQVVIAKFYIQYNTTSDFVYLVRHLAHAGICVSVRTNDPALDDGVFFDNKLDPATYPIKIIKGVQTEERAESVSATCAGVVSIGTAKETVKTLLLCDRLRNVRKTNLVLKIVAAVLGCAVMGLVLFTGKISGMTSIFPALYQLFWMLPVVFVSKIYI